MSSALTPAGSTRRWRRLRLYVLDRDGWRCRLPVDATGAHVDDSDPGRAGVCGAFAEHVDHVVPRAAADPAGLVELAGRRLHVDDPANLRAACRRGNLSRRPAAGGRRRAPLPHWSW